MRTALAEALGLPHARVRIITPDVGGGFGLKMQVFPEDVALGALSRRLGRPAEVDRGTPRESGRGVAGARPADDRRARRRGRRHRARAPFPGDVGQRRLSCLSDDRCSRAARYREHHAGSVSHLGLRVRGARAGDQQAALSAPIAAWA
jgi:hypothetical protein